MIKLIPLLFIFMITFKTNDSEKHGVSASEVSNNNVADIVRSNNAIFNQYANLVVSNSIINGDNDKALVDKTIHGRVIDLSNSVLAMKSAKLNIMENGKLVLSMNNGDKLFHHAMTPKELSYIANILNDKNMDDGIKLSKLNSLVNSITLNTQLQYNFERNASQGESYSMHR